MAPDPSPDQPDPGPSRREAARHLARHGLGGLLVFAGTAHLTFGRRAFGAQVPPWVPFDPDAVVVGSGVVEIALGAAVAAAPVRRRQLVGVWAALFFVAVFPGNVSQYRQRRDGFGLDTDRKRALRLLGQPLLIAWAWWSTRTPMP